MKNKERTLGEGNIEKVASMRSGNSFNSSFSQSQNNQNVKPYFTDFRQEKTSQPCSCATSNGMENLEALKRVTRFRLTSYDIL